MPDDDAENADDTAASQRFQRLSRYIRPSEQKSIAPVLALTVLAMLFSPLLSTNNRGRAFEVALIGTSAVVALARTGAHVMIRRVGTAIVVLATIAGATIPALHEPTTGNLEIAASGLFVVLLLITPMLVVLRLMLRPRITIDTLAGALTAYIQIGIFFGALYLFIAQIIAPTPFFAQTTSLVYSDFEYFSFITMTTVGYGDLTPATRFGQTLASIEAVAGQVFLVTVVALTVSNLGRPIRRGSATTEDRPTEDRPTDG